MLRQFFLGVVKIRSLYRATEDPVYGLEQIEGLARHGCSLSPRPLCPTLHRLHDQGYLACQSRVVDSLRRKYDTMTGKDQAALAQARLKIAELVGELLEA